MADQSPEHFVVYCVGTGEADQHAPIEIFRLGVDRAAPLIDPDPWAVNYVIGESTDEVVNRHRLRSTTDVWHCASCSLEIRMEHLDPRRRNLIVDAIEHGELRVQLKDWITTYHSPEAARRYRK